jgi:hypothetical protein
MAGGVPGKLRSRVLVGVVLFLLASPVARAAAATTQAADSADDSLGPALDHFYNLEYDAAEQQLNERLKEHPDDLRALSYLARVWMEREMLRRQMLEAQAYGKGGEAFRGGKAAVDTQLRQKIFGLLDRLERLAQGRLKANPKDEAALYWLGESHVIRAVYFLSLERSTMQALSDAKEARKYHAQLLKLDPNFVDAYLVVGTYDYIVGSLPWYTKVLAALVGYSGNRQRGLEELKRAAEQGSWARTDAQTFLSILYFREKRYADAIRMIENLEQQYPRNCVLPQEIARAYKAQENWRAAAAEYDSIARKYEARAPGYADLPLAKIYYLAAEAYARFGQEQEALHRYQASANLQENSIYVYRAELAAAKIELKKNCSEDARHRYERVAKAVPDTDEGRAASQALKSFDTASSGPSSHRQDSQ